MLESVNNLSEEQKLNQQKARKMVSDKYIKIGKIPESYHFTAKEMNFINDYSLGLQNTILSCKLDAYPPFIHLISRYSSMNTHVASFLIDYHFKLPVFAFDYSTNNDIVLLCAIRNNFKNFAYDFISIHKLESSDRLIVVEKLSFTERNYYLISTVEIPFEKIKAANATVQVIDNEIFIEKIRIPSKFISHESIKETYKEINNNPQYKEAIEIINKSKVYNIPQIMTTLYRIMMGSTQPFPQPTEITKTVPIVTKTVKEKVIEDPAYTFIKETFIKSRKSSIRKEQLFKMYRCWLLKNNIVPNTDLIMTSLRAAFPNVIVKGNGYIIGIAINHASTKPLESLSEPKPTSNPTLPSIVQPRASQEVVQPSISQIISKALFGQVNISKIQVLESQLTCDRWIFNVPKSSDSFLLLGLCGSSIKNAWRIPSEEASNNTIVIFNDEGVMKNLNKFNKYEQNVNFLRGLLW
jgi:hypothetical protein